MNLEMTKKELVWLAHGKYSRNANENRWENPL